MQIACPQCQQRLTYEGPTPNFCQFCGCQMQGLLQEQSVAEFKGTADSASDQERQPNAEVPLAASGPQSAFPSQDPIDSTVSSKPNSAEVVKRSKQETPRNQAMATVPPTGSAWDDGATVPPSTMAQSADPPDYSREAGEVVGPYETTRWLGAGGMGSVWEAVEVKTGRRVALKRLSSAMTHDQNSLQRFLQEAQLAAKISHPNVTFIYGTGQHETEPYIAMELMPGTTLEDEVEKNGPLKVRNAVDSIIDVIDGLLAVHENGMIHRDIKPSNCFIGVSGRIKIGDFGLSKSVVTDNPSLTKTGTFMGTPSYASPEQIRGVDVDRRTDQYSAGATLFYLLTGKTLYQGDATAMMAQIIGDPPPSVRALNPKVPRDLDLIIRKSIAKSADDRYASLKQLRAALLPYASNFDSVAGVGRRLAAYMIDQSLVLISFILLMVVVMIGITIANGGTLEKSTQGLARIIMVVTVGLGSWAYYTIAEGVYERTLGKWLMGLKLVNYENQKAGLLRAAIRSTLVPFGLGLGLWLDCWEYCCGDFAPPMNPAEFVMLAMYNLAIGFGPVLLCLVTMRRSNRLLGLHGWISGTRVVRCALVADQKQFPVADLRVHSVAPTIFGPYIASELLGQCEYGQVYLARDDQLSRDVWIVSRKTLQPPPASRMNLARTARQRWLDGGYLVGENVGTVISTIDELESMKPGEPQLRWDAFEAVEGMPIHQLIGTGKLSECATSARIMRDLARELVAALQDGTLPEHIELSQVLVDRDGMVQILDSPLVDNVYVSDKDSRRCLLSGELIRVQHTPEEQAVELFQQLGDVVQRSRVLPMSLRRLLNELDQRPLQLDTLVWAERELSRLEKKITKITWDIRIGVQAMTLGVEALLYSLLAAGLMLVCFYLIPVWIPARLMLGVMVSLFIPMALATYFDGGLVFHMMGIRVTGLDGRPASPIANAARAGLSWLPYFALGGGMMLALIFTDATAHSGVAEPGTVNYEVTHDGSLAAFVLVTLFVSLATLISGVIFAIYSPTRGLVDYLLSTRLMPD